MKHEAEVTQTHTEVAGREGKAVASGHRGVGHPLHPQIPEPPARRPRRGMKESKKKKKERKKKKINK